MSPLIDKVGKSSIDWVLAEQPASNWSTVPPRQRPLPVQSRHLEEEVEVEDIEGGRGKGGREQEKEEQVEGKQGIGQRGGRGATQKEGQDMRSQRKKMRRRI